MTILEQIAAGQGPSVVPLTVGQYHEMIARGILREGDPIELIDGILVRKDRADRGGDPMSHGPRHASTVARLQRCCRPVEELGYHLRIQLPVTLGATQEPEPDQAVVRGRAEDYVERHPGRGDIGALMEVADSSLTFDRTTKQTLYARASIPIYWIINLVDRQVEVYEDPDSTAGEYRSRTEHRSGTIKLTVGPGEEVEVLVGDLVS